MDPSADMVAVVTNDFHIARAKLLAARNGYGDAVGVPAELPWAHLEINYYLRGGFRHGEELPAGLSVSYGGTQ